MHHLGLRGSLIAMALLACGRGEGLEGTSPAADGTPSVPAGLRDVHCADLPLEGGWLWSWKPGYDSISLSVRKLDASTFELEFLRGTCVGASGHRTTARWTGFGLELETSAPEARNAKVLYPVRFHGQDFLVPDCAAGPYGPPRPFVSPRAEENFAFERAEDDIVQRNTQEWIEFNSRATAR